MSGPSGKGPLRISLEDFFNTFIITPFQGWLYKTVSAWNDVMEHYTQQQQAQRSVTKNIPEGYGPYIQPPPQANPFLKLILNILGYSKGVLDLLSISAEPDDLQNQRIVRRINRTNRPPSEIMAQIGIKDPERANAMHAHLVEEGLDDELIAGLIMLVQERLSPQEYELGRLRGFMSDENVHMKLRQRGISDDDIAMLDKLSYYIPPIPDLVHMADRFAADDALAAKYRRDEELSDEIKQDALSQGLSDRFFKLYWRAHWQDPSIQQVFDMYHRLRSGRKDVVFDDAELQSYLQVIPLSPYWWDKLKAVAYQPITLRYIRRLYTDGVIDKDEVYQRYLDIGMDKADARLMADADTASAKTTQKGASQAAVLSAYKDGLYSKDQTSQALLALNYTQDDVDFYISLADYEIKNQQDKIEIDIAREKYIRGVTDEVGLAKDLGALNLPSDRMTALEELWNVQRNNKIAVVSRAELDDLIIRGIITIDQYTSELTKIGYSDQENSWLVIRITHILKDNAAVELAKQQTEQERLAFSTLKTQYQVDHQNIVVAIAQFKSAIADLQYDAATTSDPNQKAQDQQLVAQYKNAVVHLNEKAANLKQTLVTNLQAASTKPPTTGG